jgi:hypothetical protein
MIVEQGALEPVGNLVVVAVSQIRSIIPVKTHKRVVKYSSPFNEAQQKKTQMQADVKEAFRQR